MSVARELFLKTWKNFSSTIQDPWKLAYYRWCIEYPFRQRRKEMYVTLPDGTKLIVADFASFFSTYKSVFIDRLYDFSSQLPDPEIVICGENIGVSAIFFKKLYPKSKIIAFEADPYIFSILKKNIKNAGFNDITLRKEAVWNKDTTLTFRQDRSDGGRIIEKQKSTKKVSVKAVDFRKFLRQHPNITFLNMDIEGAESKVLPVCLPLMMNIPYLFIEYHSFEKQEQKVGKILQSLEENKYRIHLRPVFYSNSPFKAIHTMDGMDMQVNIFAWKDPDILDRTL